MELSPKKLEKILLDGGYIREEDITAAKGKGYNTTIQYLKTEGLITKDLIGQAVAESLELEYADLNTKIPKKEQVLKIPKNISFKYRIIYFEETKNTITFATDSPSLVKDFPVDGDYLGGKKPAFKYSMTEDINPLLAMYRAPLEKRLAQILEKGGFTAPNLLKDIFSEAVQNKASDIHFEPLESGMVTLRFRIDGILQDVATFPRAQYEGILNKIKVDSQLRIDKHDEALDGALRFYKDDIQVDLRISIVPTINGEKIVIRLLSSYVEGLTLDSLGLLGENEVTIRESIAKPYGMIIVTGPTGSGKTTTLYSLMKMINRRDINITTIEDPVEYRTEGINQIQVNTDKGLTFSTGLRAVVRQDPDVILVGEIRDLETAEIGVNAALTGHLLLTTFHANNAAAAIPRLIDMGVESFLVASTLEIIVAQRLLRKICENCRYSSEVDQSEIKKYVPDTKGLFKKGKNTLYFGKGCSVCGHSGYHGRTGIFEIIKLSPEVKQAIIDNPSGSNVWDAARAQGARTMFEDGIDKVKSGITTLEELTRVAQQTEY